jgi:hypothetical protein
VKHQTRDDLVDTAPIKQSRCIAGVSDLEIDACSHRSNLTPRALQDRAIWIYAYQHGGPRRLADECEQSSCAASDICD